MDIDALWDRGHPAAQPNRAGAGDGRVYAIGFTATDVNGLSCSGSSAVTVPHDQRGAAAVDSGQAYDSFGS